MIEQIIKHTKTLAKNKTEEHAIKNVLFAKIANLLGLKNVKFNSVMNIAGEMPVAHFALNLVPSGGNKNSTVAILDTIFDFSKSFINIINEEIKENYINFKLDTTPTKTKNKENIRKEAEKEAQNQEQLIYSINDATPESIYSNAELVANLKRGYVSIKNTEFLNYFLTAINDKTSNNGKFINILYEAYDGNFESRKILNKLRPEINGITTTAILLSDGSKLTDTNLDINFKQKLLDGFARRFFLYYDPCKNYLFDDELEPDTEEIEQARKELNKLSKELEKIFNSIKENTTYIVNTDLIKILDNWYKNVALTTNKALYIDKTKRLNMEDSILAVSLFNCRWQILKLAVIIHAINDPTNKFVSSQALFDAINFYWDSYNCLKLLLYKKGRTIVDDFVQYFIKNVNRDITKTDLRSAGILTNKNTFKDIFDNLYPEIRTELSRLSYNLKIYAGSGNARFYRCFKINDIIPHPMCISIAELKDMSETPTKFEYKEMSTEEFIKLVKGKNAFVACELRGGERKNANFIAGSNVIFLDFDEIESFEATKSLFDEFAYVTYTSKNHQKDKNGKVSDRFRLILFTELFMPNDIEQHRRVMTNIINIYGADQACKDASRLYWSNPNAIVTKNKGKLFDWRKFDFNVEQEYKAVKPMLIKSTKSGKTISDVLFSLEGDKRLKVDNIVKGQRNVELFRVALFLMHLVQDGHLEHQDAIDKIKEVVNNMDDTGFKDKEKRRMIEIVERLSV